MPQILNTQNFTVSAGGATFTINATDIYAEYVIGGSAALASNNSVVFSGTAILNMNVKVRYEAVCTDAGGSVVVLGTTLDSTQIGKLLFIDCNYNGSSWDVQVYTDASQAGWITSGDFAAGSVNSTALASGAVTTAKIAANAVTFAKMEAIPDSNVLGNVSGSASEPTHLNKAQLLTLIGYVAPKDTLVIPVSFEASEQANNTVRIAYACSLSSTYLYGIATKAIAGTDDGVIQLAKNGTPIAGATITFSAGAAINTVGTNGTFSSTNFAVGDTISAIGTKTTAGGKALVSIPLTLT